MVLVAEASSAEDPVEIKGFKLCYVLSMSRLGGWGHRW